MPTVGNNLGNQHYSALTQIRKQNLHKLGPVWRTHVSAVDPATDDVGLAVVRGVARQRQLHTHGENQPGEVVFVNARDVSTAGLPQRWDFVDEWYNSIPFPTDVNFLAVVDEARFRRARDARANIPATATSIRSVGASTTTEAARG